MVVREDKGVWGFGGREGEGMDEGGGARREGEDEGERGKKKNSDAHFEMLIISRGSVYRPNGVDDFVVCNLKNT